MGLSRSIAIAALWLAAACAAPPAPASVQTVVSPPEIAERPPGPGRLILIGGGLRQAEADVHRAFLEAARPDRDLYIIPAAAAEPAQTALRARIGLIRHGAPEGSVWIAPLALRDDPNTEDVDEAAWRENASDAELADLLAEAGGFWFTGGDQSRITALLTGEDGADTPVLAAIRKAHAEGAPIAGSSAGAAMMAEDMIVRGASLPALHGPGDATGAIAFADGLALFPHGLIDQHFSQRARFGRLAAAIAAHGEATRGFGIDESTALIVEPDGAMRVAGRGYVTLIDAGGAEARRRGDGWTIENLSVTLLSTGDTYDAATGAVAAAPYKSATEGAEFRSAALPVGAGIAHPVETLPRLLGEGLIDNSAADAAERVSFGADGRGVRLRFRQTETATGYWGRARDGGGRYLVHDIRADIAPVTVSVSDLVAAPVVAEATPPAPTAEILDEGRR